MDRFKEQSREQILQKFDVLKPEILKKRLKKHYGFN